MTRQCNACQGIYETVSADGVPYFHVCAPISAVAVERNGKAILVPVAAVQPADVITVIRAGKATPIRADAIQADDQRVGDVAIERPNKRDETPVPEIVNGKRTSRPAAEGAGAIAIATVEEPAPVLVTDAL